MNRNIMINQLINEYVLSPNQLTTAPDAAKLTELARMQNTWNEINQKICNNASRGFNFCHYIIKQYDNIDEITEKLSMLGYKVITDQYCNHYTGEKPITELKISWET